jgi:hypothetical protein
MKNFIWKIFGRFPELFQKISFVFCFEGEITRERFIVKKIIFHPFHKNFAFGKNKLSFIFKLILKRLVTPLQINFYDLTIKE